MREVFGSGYAAAYDRLYFDKDYAVECDVLEALFETAGRPVRTVLDLGCGTGSHSLILAARGYEVVGVDLSAEMIERAQAKKPVTGPKPEFVLGDLRSAALGRTFDAALLMFAVLGYQLENQDVRLTLENARRHLEPDGLLIMDFWYGPAVLTERPGDRVKVTQDGESEIIRTSAGQLDARRNRCLVSFRLWELERGLLVRQVEEEHCVRYFFEPELELFLSQAGLELVRTSAFLEPEREPGTDTWNVMAVARAV